MKPITETIPKSLIPVHGQPFLHYQLDSLKQQGISQVVLCVGHMGDRIRAYAGDGKAWSLPLIYVEEGAELRGTAGALRLAFDEGKLNERFMVLYGDSFLPIDFKAFWATFAALPYPALMSVMKNDGRWDKSNVHFEADRVILYDKKASQADGPMRYIDYGLSGLTRRIIEMEIPAGTRSDLADLFNRLSLRGELGGFEVHTRFFEIGSPSGLDDFAHYLTSQRQL